MFCWYCRKEFEPKIDPLTGTYSQKICKPCESKYGRFSKTYKKIDRFCVECGDYLPIRISKRKDGSVNRFVGQRKICEPCKSERKVIYECCCKVPHKVNHHYDYSRPREVIRLCYKCHKREHVRTGLKRPFPMKHY